MKAEILHLLRKADGYVSGEEICKKFSMSRQAIWKYIHQLQDAGYEIDGVKNRGYRILNAPDCITAEEIGSLLDDNCMYYGKLHYYEETDSTNTRAKILAEEGAPHGTVVIAEQQNGGKGRRGRKWEPPQQTSIALSIVVRPEFLPEKASMLTLVAGMAVLKAVQKLTDLQVGIKWPNDIVASGKKICGILTEMSAEMEAINYVVVGIGVNVNNESFPDEIKDVATSLLLEGQKKVNRAKVAKELLTAFEAYYERFVQYGDMTALIDEYNSELINAGKQVRILGRESFAATAQGIDKEGRLLVVDEDGKKKKIVSGEVSVRGVYGYV